MIKYTIGKGLRGYYAMIYDDNTMEAIHVGSDSYDNPTDAWRDAYEWAMSEGHEREATEIYTKHL